MKKYKCFTLVIAVVSLLAINAWSGTCTVSYDITKSTTIPLCKGPPGSIMKSCRVTGEFSSSCLLQSRTITLLDGTTILYSTSMPNGKFDTTLLFPANSSADKLYYIRIDIVTVTSNRDNSCRIKGTITCTYTP